MSKQRTNMDIGRLEFILKTAFRDSRKNVGKLFLFMSSIVAGVAALVAINSFNHNLSKDIDRQAATLLGADLATTSNSKVADSLIAKLSALPGEKASEMEMFTMAYIPSKDATHFVRLKGIEGNFPFYGKIKSEPATAAKTYQSTHKLLVDESVMMQFQLKIGDTLKLGNKKFAIGGHLMSTFGSAAISSSFAPAIYLSKEDLISTDLVQDGSLINYSWYNKLPSDFDANAWKEKNKANFRSESLRMETIDDRKDNLKEAFGNLNYFLNLVAMVALLLGSIGVASSVYIYVRTKIPSIAVFRCMGMKAFEAFSIYFLQIIGLGMIAVMVGTLLGSLIQTVLPILLKDFLPMDVTISTSWKSIQDGLLIGATITALFATLPLLAIRKISPLRTLRTNVEEEEERFDPLRWAVYALIVLSLFLFMVRITSDWHTGAIFSIGLILGFTILYAVSSFIMWIVRRWIPTNMSFEWRQGIANLYRPNNQTRTLILSIGLGTAVLTTLYLTQGLLLSNVSTMDSGNQPNVILYGIETSQVEAVRDTTLSMGLPVIQSVPIVTMKLEAWKGKTKNEWFADSTAMKGGRWAANREGRVSYRDTISKEEKLIRGNIYRPVKNPNDTIFVSLADSYADALGLDLGDQMVWNVQGTLITTYVGSIRQIDFRNMSTRFFILFPTGVLEEAPQFHVIVTKSPNGITTTNYRTNIVKPFPNISVVDLGSILSAVNEILSKVSYVIKFMAFFSLITGVIVLISSLMLSKVQRIQESVLLRTLGAKRKIIYRINFIEYFVLGFLASISGVLLSLISSFLIAKFKFKLDFSFDFTSIVAVVFIITIMTVIIGLFNSREVVNKPPLEVLRRDA